MSLTIAKSNEELSDSLPAHTVTLNELLASNAADWSKDDCFALVASLRDQRERWNKEQVTGSRKRVPSKKVDVPKKGKMTLALEGLKL